MEAQAENWHRAEIIRAYIEAVKKAKSEEDSHTDGSPLNEWITWAQQQADRLDPLVALPPSVLDEEEEKPSRR